MEEIIEVVKRVILFILVFRVVRNLFEQSSYAKYFRFLEGMIVLVLMLSPVFSRVANENYLERCLEKNWLETEMEWEARELEIIDGEREKLWMEVLESSGEAEHEKR